MNEKPARILSVATALPEHRFEQHDLTELAPRVFRRELPPEAYKFFHNAGVRSRYFAVSPDQIAEGLTVKDRERIYVEEALKLAEAAASLALERAGVNRDEVDRLVVTSTTGEPTPSLDTRLQLRMGFPLDHCRPRSQRGHGCAGGAEELGEAADWCRTHPGRVALVVAVEICTTTFQVGDVTRAGLAGAAIFGDGAVAAVISTDGAGPEVLGADCRTWTGTEHYMGWQHDRRGVFLILDKAVPRAAEQNFRGSLETSARYVGVGVEELRHFLMHPGGARVIAALETALSGLLDGELDHSRAVLSEYGNMSSATVLFILERFLAGGEYCSGELGVVSAMGPGFRVEHVFFRCAEPNAA